MAERISTRLTAAEGRRFAFTVGSAFAVLALLLAVRRHPGAATVVGTLAGLLVAAGIIQPTRLGPIERAWMRFAETLSRVTNPIVMGVLYFVVIAPIGVLRRTLGEHPLIHKPGPDGFWKIRPSGQRTRDLKRQF